ncbi:MAG: GGDEF domain-containing protein [Gammaproteobacteria bacterium]|nr:GGDEF domain-containing protein [Gammaproteobacteria bacterium]
MLAVINPHNVSAQQAAQLHRYAGIGFLASLTNALILTLFLWSHLQHDWILLWLAAVLAAAATRLAYARTHRRGGRSAAADSGQTTAMLVLTAVNGMVWGATALLFYPGLAEPYQMFLIFMLSITSAGALPLYIAAPATYLLYLSCVLVPMILMLLFGNDAVDYLMALMLVIFSGTLAITAWTMHHGLMESLHKYFGYQSLASVDGLTQLANRRTFDETYRDEWNRAARASLPLSVILIDIDNFKKYNDHYGHQEGDACLREVANALARCMRRSGDLVARYGGEEFVVVLYQMTGDEAARYAEQMRAAVAGLGLVHEKNEAGYVTISLGGATCIPHSRDNPEDLVRAADDALYRAKEAGRDQVCWKSILTI